MSGGHHFYIALAHTAIAEEHADKPDEGENQRCRQVAQRRTRGKERLDRHKANGTEQQPERRAALTPRGEMRALLRVFSDGGHHRAIGTVHQAVKQAEQHKQHRGERGFHRKRQIVCHKLRRRHQRHREGGEKNKRPEFAAWARRAP